MKGEALLHLSKLLDWYDVCNQGRITWLAELDINNISRDVGAMALSHRQI